MKEELNPVIVLFNTLSPAGRAEDRPAVVGMKLDNRHDRVIRRVFKVLSRDPLKITIGQRPNTPTGGQPIQTLCSLRKVPVGRDEITVRGVCSKNAYGEV